LSRTIACCIAQTQALESDEMANERIDILAIQAIMADPMARRRLLVEAALAIQKRHGIDITREQMEAAYDRVYDAGGLIRKGLDDADTTHTAAGVRLPAGHASNRA
jgi:hypothetical protein